MKSSNFLRKDIIVAPATPPGKGAIGIVRISGQKIDALIKGLLGISPKPRYAHVVNFYQQDQSKIDRGIAIYFPAPSSYTGEDVLELHAHGGVVVLDLLIRRILELGARLAKPGEFTERAFLNDKMDLVQAEAVADLIDSSTEQAARSAQRSIQGDFSKQIERLKNQLVELRTYIEASIDFVDEEIDFLAEGKIEIRIRDILSTVNRIWKSAHRGCLLRDGITIVLAGRPNAGKSSLLNHLAGKETAIVTEWEGTTRDILRESIQLDGLPVNIIDTAGLRHTEDKIERVGVDKAYRQIHEADRVLFLIDATNPGDYKALLRSLPEDISVTKIFNKIDLTGEPPRIVDKRGDTEIHLSIKTEQGLDLLRDHLKNCVGFENTVESEFIARRRHLAALENTESHLTNSLNIITNDSGLELLAEELRLAQNNLSEITGEFTNEDLLGEIFSNFCIGK